MTVALPIARLTALAAFSVALGSIWIARPASAAEPAAAQTVGAIEIEEGESGTTIRIRGSGAPTFSVFKLDAPPRLFIDLAGARPAEGAAEMRAVDNGVVSQVAMIGVRDGGAPVARVIVGFERAAHYDVRTENNDVLVFIDGAQRRAAPAAPKESAALEAERAEAARTASALAEAEAKRAEAERARGATARELERAKTKLGALNDQLARARGTERDALQKRVADQASALEASARAARAARAKLATMETERAAARALARRATERAESAERAIALERARAERAETAASASRLAERAKSEEAERLTKELAAAERARSALETKLSKNERGSGERAERLGALESELARAQAESARLATELDDRRRAAERGVAGATDQAKRVESERARARAEAKRAKSELARAESARRAAAERAQALETKLARAASESERLRAEIARAAPDPDLPAARAVAANVVRDVRLENSGGRSRIVVDLDRPGRFETRPEAESRAVMILNNTALGERAEQRLAGSEGGAVRLVSSYARGSEVRVEAELDGAVSERVRHEGNQLVWEFAPTLAAPGGARFGAEAAPEPARAGASRTAAPPSVVVDPTKVVRVPRMSRKRTSIDLRAADIQNVLRLIAEEGGVNIIAGSDVQGTVTIRLRNVPLDEVFLTILQSQGLGYETRGNVLRVAPQSTLLAEQTARADARRASRRADPLEVFLVPVNYASATELIPQIQGLLSERGSVTVDQRTNTLVIKDISANLDPVRVLVESLDTQVPQVLIEARIVETNDTFQRQLGIQWGGDFSFSQANGNPTGLIFPNVLGVSGAATDNQAPIAGTSATPNFAVNLPAPVGTGVGGGIGLTMGSVGGAVNLNLRLSALEQQGSARIMSAPKILTLDNREATISQGTSIPISVVSAAGVQTQFVQAVLELTVLPHVTPDGNIQLQIRASKNEPDFQNTGARGDPTIIQRQAETELLIKDGDTTVIGGIYTRNEGSSVSGVPFFYKIPIIGALFQTRSQSERRNELLIFITPRIVNRAQALGSVSAGAVESDPALSAPAVSP